MKTDFQFKGMMVPVFTPFNDDKTITINFPMIDKYAHTLKTKGLSAVLVNSWAGEGTTLSCEERMRSAEEWFKATQKYGMKMFLSIDGMSVTQTHQLAEHAEQCKFDAVMVMPDVVYGKYMTEEDIIKYLKNLIAYMPTRPVFYMYDRVVPTMYRKVDMLRLLDMLEKEIPTITGMYYRKSTTIDEMVLMKYYKPNMVHVASTMMSMMAPVTEGFETFSMTMMNLLPEMMVDWYEKMLNQKTSDALVLKDKVMKYWIDWMRNSTYSHMNPTTIMKLEWNKKYPQLSMGPLRMPTITTQHMLY